MASRRSKWGDELEGKFSGRDSKRRWRSDQRKRNSRSFESLDSDERKKKHPSKPLGGSPREGALRGNWYDMSPDERLDEDEAYGLDFDEGLDPNSDGEFGGEGIEDSEVDYSPDDWH